MTSAICTDYRGLRGRSIVIRHDLNLLPTKDEEAYAYLHSIPHCIPNDPSNLYLDVRFAKFRAIILVIVKFLLFVYCAFILIIGLTIFQLSKFVSQYGCKRNIFRGSPGNTRDPPQVVKLGSIHINADLIQYLSIELFQYHCILNIESNIIII